MPRLSDSMTEGTIVKWLKSVGDEVAVGDELVEIETDKANMVFEADAAGTLIEIAAEEGDTLQIGEVIARIGTASEIAPVDAATDGRMTASPIARRMAQQHGIDIHTVAGSGHGGRIVKADIEAALASGSAPTEDSSDPARDEQRSAPSPAQAGSSAPPPGAPPAVSPSPPVPAGAPPGAEKVQSAKGRVDAAELTKLQETVARRMAESKATAPHFYLEAEIDMSGAVAARERIKAAAGEGEVVPSLNDIVVKAAALALRVFPRVNGAYRDGRLELYSRINIGVAVAAEETLVVPTLFDADAKGLREIAAETRALAQRVRDATITPPELSGGTFTVSNLGMFGVRSFQAVINPPQAAILAIGEVAERPVVRDGEITTAHLMSTALACDHRILYGADGAVFLRRVRELLEEPLGLAL